MLEVRRLRLLREVHRRGTLGAAAEALHLSPSAVSQQLTLLERETGVELLRKVGRGVQLTAQGEILVDHATVVLTQLERAETDLAASMQQATGTVRVALFQSAALALLPDMLAHLAHHHPLLRVNVVQSEPESALRGTWGREFDLVVAEQYPHHSAPHLEGLDRMDLTTDEVSLAVPLEEPATSLRELSARAWVMEPAGVASRHFAEQVCRVAGFEPDVRYETADLQAHIRLVETGHAIAMLPGLLGPGRRQGLRLLPLPDRPRRTIFSAARDASSARLSVLACREALSSAVARSETQ